ncbi:GspH/FimT family pseudopilin [uncultured Thiodictyon sp.]|uniref:GspH/FimT family pseudopilin n=1 Tax=uncultured Thiodictyon sp. TaxID=1846217 RepID=UPI0025DD32A1|nr:GspH/FimT family pseudopilin [uncultured Thiodictyon sp.]
MLNHPERRRGFTLIELVVGMAILSVLLVMGLRSFMDWIQNGRIRTATESLQNGLQLTRAEAVRRNTTVRFQLTDTLTAACALAVAGPNWVVSVNPAAGACAATPADPPLPPNVADANNPYIVQTRPAAEGTGTSVIAATQAEIDFNGLGRVTNMLAGRSTVQIDISNATGTCLAAGGTWRCLRIVVSAAGQMRLCDPAVTAASDPRKCS